MAEDKTFKVVVNNIGDLPDTFSVTQLSNIMLHPGGTINHYQLEFNVSLSSSYQSSDTLSFYCTAGNEYKIIELLEKAFKPRRYLVEGDKKEKSKIFYDLQEAKDYALEIDSEVIELVKISSV